MNVRDLWAALEGDSRAVESGFLVRRVPGDRDLHLAIDKAANRRFVMLKIATTDLPAGLSALPETVGFSVATIAESQTGRVAIHLTQGSPAFSELFTILVEDVVERMLRTDSDRVAARALFERLVRWHQFLKTYGTEGLDDEGQRGLFGELWFLKTEVIPAVGAISALNSWAGPLGNAQDFQLPGRAVETKVSTAKQLQRLKISNERQLDDSGCGTLLLLHLSLDARSTGEATLPHAVRDVRELASAASEAAVLLEDRLLAAGYHDMHAHRYARMSYSLRGHNYFAVRDGFPRITERMLGQGVGDVTYSVAVAACMPFHIDETEARRIIMGQP